MTNRRSRASRGIAVASLGVAISCAPQVTLTPLGDERTYPATPDSVAIPLYTVTKPDCPYDEVAALTAEGWQPDDVVLEALRKKARAVGGQAIIGYTQSSRGSKTSDIAVRSGTAIRFRSADCMK